MTNYRDILASNPKSDGSDTLTKEAFLEFVEKMHDRKFHIPHKLQPVFAHGFYLEHKEEIDALPEGAEGFQAKDGSWYSIMYI